MELKNVKVRATLLTKQYEMAPKKTDKMKSLLLKADFPKFWAVRGISFEAYEGETIAVVGTNGSGKSTLMKMIAGIIPPTTGEIEINGETSLIAINAGLKGNISGRENIRLKGLMMGMTEVEIEEKMDSIIAFSELGKFIDQRVKTYSSGMKSKLGFSISVHANPDILIVDEALSVGDATFTKKSLAKIKEFQKQGKTIFFVSHSLGQVRDMASRVLWVHYGEVRMFDETKVVMDAYDKFIKEYKALSNQEQAEYRKKFRDEQELFSLDDLYYRELMMRKENLESTYSESERNQLYKLTHRKKMPTGITKLDRVIIAGLVLFGIFLADKAILNLSMKEIFDAPSSLVTNWAPSKIADLDDQHRNAIVEKGTDK